MTKRTEFIISSFKEYLVIFETIRLIQYQEETES